MSSRSIDRLAVKPQRTQATPGPQKDSAARLLRTRKPGLRISPVFQCQSGDPGKVSGVAGDEDSARFQGRGGDDQVGVVGWVTTPFSFCTKVGGSHQDWQVNRNHVARIDHRMEVRQLLSRSSRFQTTDDFIDRHV